MGEPRGDFSKLAAKVWLEDQLKEEVQKLTDEKEKLKIEKKELEREMAEKVKIIEEMKTKFAASVQQIKEKDTIIQKKDETIKNMQLQINRLKAELEEEKSKSFKDYLFGKKKK